MDGRRFTARLNERKDDLFKVASKRSIEINQEKVEWIQAKTISRK